MNTTRLLFLALSAAGSLSLMIPHAHAQMSMGTGGGGGGGGGGPGGGGGGGAAEEEEKKAPPPPSAIPGAVAGTVIPASKNAADLDPNAALFDAIDRGDIGSAREALGRGADLNARNVLGQRPIDLSIDLSRNDITFLLLSMRSQNGDQAPAADSSGDDTADADLPPSHSAQVAATTPVEAKGARGAQFASTSQASGGTPQPSAGFLGFGAR